MLPLQITEMNRAASVRKAAEVDDARMLRIGERGEQLRAQGEVAQIIGAELQLEAVGRDLAFWRHHDAGIVDQDIEAGVFAPEPAGKVSDALQRREVKVFITNVCSGVSRTNVLQRPRTFIRVASCQYHLGACSCQCKRALIAQAAGRTGDDRSSTD